MTKTTTILTNHTDLPFTNHLVSFTTTTHQLTERSLTQTPIVVIKDHSGSFLTHCDRDVILIY